MKEILNKIEYLINNSDAIIIGAGSGLSTSAGFIYTGDRFNKYFKDFSQKYKFKDMYSGGFYPYKTQEEYWAYWSRYIYINRYMKIPNNTYKYLYNLIKDKNYFIITTNVDHCFQKSGFAKDRLFYTQGDYGLFQCSTPCHNKTYDNEEIIKKMILSQGFKIQEDGSLLVSDKLKMTVSSELIPKCPICGEPMTVNLRSDDKFVEDDTWHNHADMYTNFIINNKDKNILFLELGVGFNTPGIIRIPFEDMTYKFAKATLIRVNKDYLMIPDRIKNKSYGFKEDITDFLKNI